jgi:hypothetical protein
MQGMSVFIFLSSNGLAAHKLMGVRFMFTQYSFTTPPMYHQVLWILKPLYSDHQAYEEGSYLFCGSVKGRSGCFFGYEASRKCWL